ncbi:MAG: hypothetical protein MZU95_09995 [Desulfomicrobium escambiense]|nr:hypothetical protein [Desulfomicrobium escambiense]
MSSGVTATGLDLFAAPEPEGPATAPVRPDRADLPERARPLLQGHLQRSRAGV